MSELKVLFEVPRFIQAGLESGIFKRVGGVIVESGTKQVVAWLRDSGVIETVAGQAMNIATSAVNPLNFVFTIAQTAVSLLDGHATRNAIAGVSEQVVALSQQTQIIGSLTMLTLSGQVVNLAFSAITFQIILRRLDSLSAEIDKLGKEMMLQFQIDRDMRFRVALQAARDALETKHIATRDNAVRSAIDGLYEAQENFFRDFKDSIEKAKNDPKFLLVAQQQLIRAIYAVISRIRCYAVTGDTEIAKQRLREDIPQFRQFSETLIKAWLGDHPSLYFHRLIETPYLDRFFQIESWLLDAQPNDPKSLFKIVNAMRDDFWREDLDIERNATPIALLNRFVQKDSAITLSPMLNALNQCEIIIENIDRLRGFELELSSLRLSLDNWNEIVPEQDLKTHGGAIIFAEETEGRFSHLMM